MRVKVKFTSATCLTFTTIFLTVFSHPPQEDEIQNQTQTQKVTTSLGNETVSLEINPNPIYGLLSKEKEKQISIMTSINISKGPGSRPNHHHPPPSCTCGIRNHTGKSPRIYNGEETKINEFPWRISINPRINPSVSICSGTLISPEWVLTSASCLYHRPIEYLLVDLGDHDLMERDEAENVYVSISAKIIHEKYRPEPKNILSYPSNNFEDYDIALLRLTQPVIEKNIQPICLPPKSDIGRDFTGTRLLTSAWGLQQNNENNNYHERTKTLHKVPLTYYSNQQFRQNIQPTYFPNLDLKLGQSIDRLFFTFDENKGIFPLDFGASVEYSEMRNGLYHIIGIANSLQIRQIGNGKKIFLGGWTDVSKYLDWIEFYAKDLELCSPKPK